MDSAVPVLAVDVMEMDARYPWMCPVLLFSIETKYQWARKK